MMTYVHKSKSTHTRPLIALGTRTVKANGLEATVTWPTPILPAAGAAAAKAPALHRNQEQDQVGMCAIRELLLSTMH